VRLLSIRLISHIGLHLSYKRYTRKNRVVFCVHLGQSKNKKKYKKDYSNAFHINLVHKGVEVEICCSCEHIHTESNWVEKHHIGVDSGMDGMDDDHNMVT